MDIEKIAEFYKASRNNEIYIISEAEKSDWDIRVKKYTPPKKEKVTLDPLVVGVTSSKDCYLIDHFDTTTFENYVAKEFTS